MKCLSIRQPHLQALLEGVKPAEYRTWQTRHRGPVLLHAGLKIDHDAVADYAMEGRTFATGCLLAVAVLVDIQPDEEYGDFAWTFADIRLLAKPIPYVGNVGLFNVDGLTADELRTISRRARA
jgi:hypothetical protein